MMEVACKEWADRVMNGPGCTAATALLEAALKWPGRYAAVDYVKFGVVDSRQQPWAE